MFEEFVGEIVSIALASVVGLGGFSSALTALLKQLSVFNAIPSKTISIIVVLAVFGIAMLADGFGYVEQFDNVFNVIVVIVVSLTGTAIGSSATYQLASTTNTPVLGASRNE